MNKIEMDDLADFVMKNYKKYSLRPASFEICSNNDFEVWYLRVYFYEADSNTRTREFKAYDISKQPENLEFYKNAFLDFCKNFNRKKCDKCGQYLDF